MIPIFILSSERSGSNLLRRILGAHSLISAPPPLHLFHTLSELLIYTGPLNQSENIQSIVEDAVARTKIKGTHLSWNIDIDLNKIYSNINTGSLPEIIYMIYKQYTDSEQSKFCIIKENNLYEHVDYIINYLNSAKFIFLVRDARDVICSNKKIKSRKGHVYALAEKWNYEQTKNIQIYNKISLNNKIILIRYEDLLNNPYNEIERICKFIGIDFESEMIHFHNDESANIEANKTEYWKNLNQPLMKYNQGKYLKELSRREIHIVETVTRQIMEILGYSLLTSRNLRIGVLKILKYRLLDNFYRKIYHRNIYRDDSLQHLNKEMNKILNIRKKAKKRLLPLIHVSYE